MEKYKCIDCRKEIKDVKLDDATKKKCPTTPNGFFLIICNDCKES